jgi:hypothetical protein
MIKQILISLILIFNQTIDGQTKFAKIIDFGGTPQYADQLVEYKGNYYMAYTQIGVDSDGELLESQGGIIKLDDQANMLDSNLIRSFSDNNNCLVIDSINEKIYFTGEEYFKTDYAHRFMVNEFNIDDFKSVTQSFYKYPNDDQINYFQLGTLLTENKLILIGSSRNVVDTDIKSILFAIDNLSIDTTFTIDFGLSTLPLSLYLDLNNNLVFHFLNQNQNPLNDKTIVLKLDTNFQEVWRWESEKIGLQLPYGCQLSDGRMLVAMHTPGFHNIGSIWCIKEDKSIAWKMEFPEKSGKILRRISRLKQLKDGNIIGCGTYGNLTLSKEIRIVKVPFIFKITKEGQFLWEKAFYNERPILDFVNGYLSDVVEMENGDLMAVGRIDNYLEYDPVVFQGRPDPDILIIRMDANGCIDPKCETITKIESTVSTTQHHETTAYTAFLFPNPSDGSMELMNHTVVASVSVFDLNGSLLFRQADPGRSLDLTGLPTGLYIAHLTLKDNKVIKQKMVVR